jgi:hypothetical protein
MVASEDAVSLLSFFSVAFEVAANGGEDTSFDTELEFLDNHENGLERFLVVSGDGDMFFMIGGCGGAPHGKEGKTPESPCDFTTEVVEDLEGRGGGFDACVEDLDREGLSSAAASSRLTSSRDIVDKRWDVRRGDLGGRESELVCESSANVSKSPFSGTTGTGGGSDDGCRVVVVDEEDGRRAVSDLVAAGGEA